MFVDYFDFTKEFTVSSSLIDSVYFNENDGTAVLDVDDTLYRYSGVNGFDISALVRGDENGSVGAYYNQSFKNKFGPAEKLGHYSDFDPRLVPVVKNDATTTAKDLAFAGGDVLNVTGPTEEYSLNLSGLDEPVNVQVTANREGAPTKEFALSFDDEVPTSEDASGIEGVSNIVVHFTLDNFDRKYKYNANALTVEDAIEELNDYVSVLGARGRVRKVVVKFD